MPGPCLLQDKHVLELSQPTGRERRKGARLTVAQRFEIVDDVRAARPAHPTIDFLIRDFNPKKQQLKSPRGGGGQGVT